MSLLSGGVSGRNAAGRRAAFRFAAAASLALYAGYVTTLFLYLAPPSSITAGLRPFVRAHGLPMLEQNWSLFAPNPERYRVEVSARVHGDRAGGWTNVSQWFAQRIYANRFSPDALAFEAFSHALSAVGSLHNGRLNAGQPRLRADLAVIERTSACVLRKSDIQAARLDLRMDRFRIVDNGLRTRLSSSRVLTYVNPNDLQCF